MHCQYQTYIHVCTKNYDTSTHKQKKYSKKMKIGTIKCTLSDLKCKKYEENGWKGSMFYDKMDHYIPKINLF